MGFGQGHDPSNDDLFGNGIPMPTANDAGTGFAGNEEDIGQSNGFTYGGYAGDLNGHGGFQQGTSSADRAAGRFQGLGQQWANQQAPQLNLDQANGYMGQGDSARGQQQDALAMQRDAALGLTPSVAQQQMAYGNADAMRQQLALAGSARGAGAMGMAQYGAAQNAGNMQAQNIAQTGMLRAQEMANARGAYMQGATGIRGQDYGAAQLSGDWAGQNAGLQMQQHGLGLQGQLGFEGLGNNVNQQQLQAQIAQQAARQGKWIAQTGTDANSTQAGTQAVLGLAGAGAGVASDANAKMKIQALPAATLYSDARAKENAFKAGVAAGVDVAAAVAPKPAPPPPPAGTPANVRMGAAGWQAPEWYPTVQTNEQPMHRAPPPGPPVNMGSVGGWQSPQAYPTVQTSAPQPSVTTVAPGLPPGVAAMQVTSDARAKNDAYLAGAADAMRKDLDLKFGSPSAVTAQVPASPLDAAHDAIPAHTFEYKQGVPGTQPGVPQAGIIAQQAETHPLTAAMVREDPRTGLKALDVPTATSFTLAASSDHNKRIRALEGALKGLDRDFGYAGRKGDVDAVQVRPDTSSGGYGPLSYGGEIYRQADEPQVLAYGGQ